MTQDSTETKLYCYAHPDRETMLRCNRCDRPICAQCAVLTPTGYRCKECVRGQLKVFDTAQWWDYPLAFGLAGVLSFLGSWIAQFLGWFVIFVAPIIGVIIAEAVRWVIHRRRSRLLFQMAVAGVVLGALPLLLLKVLTLLLAGSGAFGLLGLLWPAIYTFLVSSTAYYRLSGIRIG